MELMAFAFRLDGWPFEADRAILGFALMCCHFIFLMNDIHARNKAALVHEEAGAPRFEPPAEGHAGGTPLRQRISVPRRAHGSIASARVSQKSRAARSSSAITQVRWASVKRPGAHSRFSTSTLSGGLPLSIRIRRAWSSLKVPGMPASTEAGAAARAPAKPRTGKGMRGVGAVLDMGWIRVRSGVDGAWNRVGGRFSNRGSAAPARR